MGWKDFLSLLRHHKRDVCPWTYPFTSPSLGLLTYEMKTNVLTMASWQSSVPMTSEHVGGKRQDKEASLCSSLRPTAAQGGTSGKQSTL